MAQERLPKHFEQLQQSYPEYMQAVAELGQVVRQTGPLDEKSINLIQMAAAATLRLEGGVHSHGRRALAAGATPQELCQALIVLTSTIGFPAVATALSWIGDLDK
jgi:4-carboxymuconolactone decarboxylase